MGVVSISKMPPYLFRNFRCIDKTVMRPSYFYYGNAIPRKTIFILKRGPDTHIPELVWAEEVLNTMLIQPCFCDTDVSVLKPKIFSIGVNPLRAGSVFSFYYHFLKKWDYIFTFHIIPLYWNFMGCLDSFSRKTRSPSQWASYQIRKIAGCACIGNAGNVFPATNFKGNR